jgi:sterol-4alpha-carboxylate 3-dehydrogenase (decarboxylating)
VLRGFVASYKAGRTHVQIGSNTNLFDWTYVGNVVHAHLLAAVMLDLIPGVGGEIFFVTNGAPIPFWDFPRMLWARLAAASVAPLPVKKTVVISRAVAMFIALIAELVAWATGKEPILTRFRVKFSCATRWHSIDKARRILGYSPLVSNEEGIERTVKVRSLIRLSDISRVLTT